MDGVDEPLEGGMLAASLLISDATFSPAAAGDDDPVFTLAELYEPASGSEAVASSLNGTGSAHEDDSRHDDDSRTLLFRDELRVWWSMAWPIGLAILFRNATQLCDLLFIARLGTPYLAGASVANMWIVITSAWLWKSWSGAVNTLCSQAWGAGDARLVGLWAQIAAWTILIMCGPVLVAWLFTADALRAIGMREDDCDRAQLFVSWYSLYLVPGYVYIVGCNYLYSFKIVKPVLVINAIGLAVNAGLNYALVLGIPDVWPGIGFIGSPIASSCTAALSLALLVVYMLRSPEVRATWPGATCTAFSPPLVRTFLAQAAPSAVGTALEDWQMQVMAFLAASLDDASIATHNAFLYTFFVATCFMYGSVKATTVRIGHYMGARKPHAAQRVAVVDFIVSAILAVVVGVLMLSTRSVIGRLFSSDDTRVWDLASQIALPAGIGYFALAFFLCAMAILQGQGRPTVVALAYVVGAWGTSVPLAFVFVRKLGMGVQGIWIALVCGYCVITILGWLAVWYSDWGALADAAVERSARQRDAEDKKVTLAR